MKKEKIELKPEVWVRTVENTLMVCLDESLTTRQKAKRKAELRRMRGYKVVQEEEDCVYLKDTF